MPYGALSLKCRHREAPGHKTRHPQPQAASSPKNKEALSQDKFQASSSKPHGSPSPRAISEKPQGTRSRKPQATRRNRAQSKKPRAPQHPKSPKPEARSHEPQGLSHTEPQSPRADTETQQATRQDQASRSFKPKAPRSTTAQDVWRVRSQPQPQEVPTHKKS